MGRVYWITGASSGIGEGLCHEAVKQGNKVIISARSEDKLKKIAGDNPNIKVLPLDLENLSDDVVDRALELFGSIDVLVNNGGISQRSLARDTDYDVFERLINVNYLGTVKLSLLLLKYFRERKSGQYVVTTSLTGKFGTPMRSGYAASKHALHGFFDSLRAEETESNIKITLICPGFVKTDITYNAVTGDGSAQGTMDDAQSKAMTPSQFAVKMYKAIEAEKNEAYIGGREVAGIYLKRFMPDTFAKIIAKAKVT